MRKVKKHLEVKWSEVVRKSIADYITKKEIAEGVVPASKLANMFQSSNIDITAITVDKAPEQYEKGRKKESQRLSTTQTSS